MTGAIWIIDAVVRELMLFAAAGLLIGGIDDWLVDAVYLARRAWRRGVPPLSLATLAAPAAPGRLAVFVAAWDEVAVIGGMLSAALARLDHPDYRLYVGAYPNDRATIDAIAAVAVRDARVRLVINARPGPTTKADCLNALWRALRRDEQRDGVATKAVVIHDAEDVVHAAELRVFDTLIEGRAVVQLPVLPLIKHGSPWISGHYADEFAEHHGKGMVVRTALGAAMPLAGTGCAIATDTLATIAAGRGGDPFDATSLTEDYELGLHIAGLGGEGMFARVADATGSGLVAVRAFFPASVTAATRQKARWMTGIALAGWDRTGWARPLAVGDHWMRMRDRRAPLAVLVLAVAYLAVVGWAVALVAHWWGGAPPPTEGLAAWLVAANTALLGWRLAMRAAFTARYYGRREAWLSLPRFFVGNLIALIAAPRALARYLRLLRGHALVWDKTRHDFPDLEQAA